MEIIDSSLEIIFFSKCLASSYTELNFLARLVMPRNSLAQSVAFNKNISWTKIKIKIKTIMTACKNQSQLPIISCQYSQKVAFQGLISPISFNKMFPRCLNISKHSAPFIVKLCHLIYNYACFKNCWRNSVLWEST